VCRASFLPLRPYAFAPLSRCAFNYINKKAAHFPEQPYKLIIYFFLDPVL
jgi:hypothetical protein